MSIVREKGINQVRSEYMHFTMLKNKIRIGRTVLCNWTYEPRFSREREAAAGS